MCRTTVFERLFKSSESTSVTNVERIKAGERDVVPSVVGGGEARLPPRRRPTDGGGGYGHAAHADIEREGHRRQGVEVIDPFSGR